MKIIALDELVTDGWFQELNRQFFHPRGLHVAILTDGQGNPFMRFEDYRDEAADGVLLDLVNRQLAINIERIHQETLRTRMETLGYDIQPIPLE